MNPSSSPAFRARSVPPARVAWAAALVAASLLAACGSSGGSTDAPPAPVAGVTVTLTASSLTVGQTTQARATLVDASGNVLTGRTVTWSSANPAVAAVNALGLVTAMGEGTTSITATSEGKSGGASATVGPAPVATVTVTLQSPFIAVGQTTLATATLRDAQNATLTGRTVAWSSSAPAVATVDDTGLVTAVGSGTAVVIATSEGKSGSAPVTVTATPAGPPTQLAAVTALRQTAEPGVNVIQPPAVKVTDASGVPVPGVRVDFAVTAGGGTVSGNPATTDASGVARLGSWTLGAEGAQSLRASSPAVAGISADFAGTARPVGSGFDITFRLKGSMTDGQLRAFVNARERIQEVVVGDLEPTMVYADTASLAGCPIPGGVGGMVDDLLIIASITPIDGPGQVLGQAGPCLLRPNWVPFLGIMEFDSADVAYMENRGTLDAVILHEMMHVIGFGTTWLFKGVLDVGTATDPIFTGASANAEFLSANGGGSYAGRRVPVENTGGDGTKDSHWRETVFVDELMTGWLSGTSQPLSRTTIGSLADLGYVVDLARADPFSILATLRALPWEPGPEPIFLGNDVRKVPPVRVDAAGRPMAP